MRRPSNDMRETRPSGFGVAEHAFARPAASPYAVFQRELSRVSTCARLGRRGQENRKPDPGRFRWRRTVVSPFAACPIKSSGADLNRRDNVHAASNGVQPLAELPCPAPLGLLEAVAEDDAKLVRDLLEQAFTVSERASTSSRICAGPVGNSRSSQVRSRRWSPCSYRWSERRVRSAPMGRVRAYLRTGPAGRASGEVPGLSAARSCRRPAAAAGRSRPRPRSGAWRPSVASMGPFTVKSGFTAFSACLTRSEQPLRRRWRAGLS